MVATGLVFVALEKKTRAEASLVFEVGRYRTPEKVAKLNVAREVERELFRWTIDDHGR